MNFLKLSLSILLYGFSTAASAKLIQIIHTNDLHSFFEGTRNGFGGYSRIKTLVDKLKADAASKGIKTLFLDGGDFGEGSSFYFSNKGVDAFKAIDLLGIDVTVLGNHDFILGGLELARQMKESNLKAHLLSANLIGKKNMGLTEKIKDFVDYDLDGMKIRIFGLTTPELHFQYSLLPQGLIGPSHRKGIRMASKAKKDGVDFLIALTHIGVGKDTILASHSRTINMIIGGHSHTRLEQPKMVENLNGELIPVYQTGAHGTTVGSVIVDVLGDGEAKIIDSRLYDVSKDLDEDTDVKKFVSEAYVNREQYFNRNWKEVIGFTEIPLSGSYGGKNRNSKSCWSRHVARLTREKAETELSIQFDNFQGEEIPVGHVSFGDMVDNFPHNRTWGDMGWNITRGKVHGLILKKALKLLDTDDVQYSTTIDGIEIFDPATNRLIPYETGTHKPSEALIKGEKISIKRTYTMAMPSEMPFAVGQMSGALRDLLLMKSEPVENSYFWPLFEEYLAKNSPLKCLIN